MAERLSRRTALISGLGLGVSLCVPCRAQAQEDASASRPRPGDVLVRDGDESKTPLTPADVAGDAMLLAWAMDPVEGVVRNGSRFNHLTLVRVGDEVLAHTIICTHDGCDVTDWLPAEHKLSCPCHFSSFDVTDGSRVTSGPAPRALPRLPLSVMEGKLVVATPFTSRVGFESQ